MRNLTENESRVFRSLRGGPSASAPSVGKYMTLTDEEVEKALQSLVEFGLAKVKRINRKGRKVYSAY